MTRHQVGWAMVAIAGALLVLQLVPAEALRPRAPRATTLTSTLSHTYSMRRLFPAQDGIYVARAEGSDKLEILGWTGQHAGEVRLPTTVGALNPGWGISQSPSGARFIDGTLLMDITGDTIDLGRLADPARVFGFTWRDDSEGACALRDDGGGAASLVEFFFNPHSATTAAFSLPPGFGFADQTGPRVLVCNRARRVALVGLVGLDHSARVLVLDLVTGEELGRRVYPAGSAASLVASADGRLLALDAGPDLSIGPAGPTVVREVDTDRVILDLGPDLAVRGFSSTGRVVVASSPFQPGARIVTLADGHRRYEDTSNRVLLGWLARPGTDDFALALGVPEINTCTKGEPGKFPQFCRYGPVQSLEIVAGDPGRLELLGSGAGLWGYRVN